MWKHKLQEILSESIDLPDIIREAREKINEATCFYLEDVEYFEPLCERLRLANTPALYPSEFKMPYDTCLYEALVPASFSLNKYKVMALVYKENEYSNIFKIVTFMLEYGTEKSMDYATRYGIFGGEFDSLITKRVENNEEIEDDRSSDLFSVGCSIAHLTLMLLSCKNVTTCTILPPAKLNKKRRKNNRLPLCEYKILEVKPLSGIRSSTVSPSQPSQGLMRVHLCRGHFKEYPLDRPLFGKYSGRFWWKPMVRGEKKRGAVNKDYSLSV